MFCVRQHYDQTMFGSGSSAGNLMAAAAAPFQSLKKRRRESVGQQDDGRQSETEGTSLNKVNLPVTDNFGI